MYQDHFSILDITIFLLMSFLENTMVVSSLPFFSLFIKMQEESIENPNMQAVAQLRILQNSYCLYSNVNSYNQCMNFNRFYEIAILCCLYTQSRILFRIQIFIRHIMLKKQQ